MVINKDDLKWEKSVDVISSAAKFVIRVPKSEGDPLIFPDGDNAGQPITDWKGNPVGESGIVFYNGVDKAYQAVASNGEGVIIVNDVTPEIGAELSRRLSAFEDDGDTRFEAVKRVVNLLHELNLHDVYNSDMTFIKEKMKGFSGEPIDADTFTQEVCRRDDRDICQALFIRGQGEFQGPAVSPQKFKEGAVIVKQSDDIRLVDPDVFIKTYSLATGDKLFSTDDIVENIPFEDLSDLCDHAPR